MRFNRPHIAAAAFVTAAAAQTQYTATGTAAVAKARATALTESPTSYVKGQTFDRFVAIFLENADYDSATADRETSLLLQYTPTIETNIISKSFLSREPRY